MRRSARARGSVALSVLLWLGMLAGAVPPGAAGEQASDPGSSAAEKLDAGGDHTCAILADGGVRCWGYDASGQLGYGNTNSVGDDETPASVGPVPFGAGRAATAIAAGTFHTCAILNDGSMRCWGFGGDGRLGYGNTSNLGDTPSTTPGKLGPVDLGPGRTARAITAGAGHTCAILDDGSVRCWGFGANGRLGYGNTSNAGDTPASTPDKLGPVNLGAGRTATAISAGGGHTCAILDDGSVRCWGFDRDGELGYGTLAIGEDIGDTPATLPDTVGPVNLGGHKATAVSAGGRHTCAILDDGSVRCWGYAGAGQLGYGNTSNLGETLATTPEKAGPVSLGPGRTARAISAGLNHTCAILDDGTVRCWGYGLDGRLGYGNTHNVGDTPATTPDKVGPVDLGPGRMAVAISAGDLHTCALLDNGSVRCWGDGANGRLGYCSTSNVGDTPATLPGKVGPVSLKPGDGGECAGPPAGAHRADPLRVQALRARALRSCVARAGGGGSTGPQRSRAGRRRSLARRNCRQRYGRTPGAIAGLHARAISSTTIVITFAAPGSDGHKLPAARAYLVKQSTRPIRSARDLQHAQTLCHGYCRFHVITVGTRIKLTINRLRPHTTYYYAIAGRDNVSGRLGPWSRTVQIQTR